MPRRQRWTPVKGTANRVYDRRERWLIQALDLLPRALVGARGIFRRPRSAHVDLETVRDVLVLRLDRIGDVLMSLPALAELRAALPHARLRLAVGRWSEEVARSAPVDEVLVWSAPWAGRADEGASSARELAREAWSLRHAPPDVALDLQGDVRASVLLRLTGARRRIGYANTGGGWLLTDVVPLDETVSWVEQNRRAVGALIGSRPPVVPEVLTEADRGFAVRLFNTLGLEARRPLVGIHPSGGRMVKQWDPARWGQVGARLQEQYGATVVLTGSAADRDLARQVAAVLPQRAYDVTGRLTVRETMAVIGSLDLFLSSDTGTMHMACAVGTPSVSLFGPSDPRRYFSGGDDGRHTVVRPELWCSPCNLIRKPPLECRGAEPPECLRAITVDEVHREAARLLSEVRGFARRVSQGAPA
jgi:ADP-heptose:LPS heptosyltransferase